MRIAQTTKELKAMVNNVGPTAVEKGRNYLLKVLVKTVHYLLEHKRREKSVMQIHVTKRNLLMKMDYVKMSVQIQ